MITKQVARELSRLYVFSELLERQAVPYVPLVAEELDALVKSPDGSILELQIDIAGYAGGKDRGWFQASFLQPRPTLFILGVEADSGGHPRDCWIFPASVFSKYATRPAGDSTLNLYLDSVTAPNITLQQKLKIFRNRWDLLVQYKHYKDLMLSVAELEAGLVINQKPQKP